MLLNNTFTRQKRIINILRNKRLMKVFINTQIKLRYKMKTILILKYISLEMIFKVALIKWWNPMHHEETWEDQLFEEIILSKDSNLLLTLENRLQCQSLKKYQMECNKVAQAFIASISTRILTPIVSYQTTLWTKMWKR